MNIVLKYGKNKMKIGLLECDHVRDEFRHIAGDYRDMFPALFTPVASDWEFVFYDVANGHFPMSIDECDAYLCTGSKASVYDDEPWIHQLKDFVKALYQANKIFIGVCFGHQMLAEALGGKVQKAAVGWCVGVHQFSYRQSAVGYRQSAVDCQRPKAHSSLSNVKHQTSNVHNQLSNLPLPTSFNLLMMCQDQVVELPPDSTVLASTSDCPVAMFRVGERMLGIQAHPEFSIEYEEALMGSRIERIGIEKVTKGLESLSLPLDSEFIAKWIADFVTFAF